LQIQVASMKAKGKPVSDTDEKELLDHIRSRYTKQTSPYYAAARLWVDGLIDPLETRGIISLAIEAANHNPDIPAFKMGVIQVGWSRSWSATTTRLEKSRRTWTFCTSYADCN